MLPLINRISNPSSVLALVLSTPAMIYWNFHLYSREMQLPVRFRIFATCYVTCVSWRAKTITCTYLAKELKKIKCYQKMLVNNMAYSRISLSHIQQKIDRLTIAVIRKRCRWTANMAVAWIVSSGGHLCCFLHFFLFVFSTQGTISCRSNGLCKTGSSLCHWVVAQCGSNQASPQTPTLWS